MKTKAALLAALAALAANAVQMATENWVSNRLTEATAPIRESVAALNSATQTLQSAVGSLAGNVYTKQETDDRIVELSPPTSLESSTNYTDSALREFSRTNAVLKAGPYVKRDSATPSGQTLGGGFRVNGWISSTGTVSVVPGGPSLLEVRKPQTWMDFDCFGLGWGTGGWVFDKDGFHRQFQEFPMEPWALGPAFSFPEDAYETGGVLALRSDIPDMSGYTTPADVTAAIREQSLGGIWDETLQVWWTPRMRNGSLTYEATTNVNLNAEN